MTVSDCAISEISLESAKQLKRWLAYVHAHELLPTTALTFSSPDTPTALVCLRVDRVEGIVVPRLIHERFGSAARLQICLRLSFFHERTLQVFGRTIQTAPIAYSASEPNVAFNAHFYFRTRICDPTAFAVGEVVILVLDPVDNVSIETIAVGWSTMSVFNRVGTALPPLSSALSKGKSTSSFNRPIFQGTARALFAIDPCSDWKAKMKPAGAGKLFYDLFDASSLSEATSNLIRENEMVTAKSIIAGLPQRGIATVLTSPTRTVLAIGAPRVSIPHGLEYRVLSTLDELKGKQTGFGASVVQRRLILGIHNGRCFIHTPIGLELLCQSDRSDAFNYIFEGVSTIKADANLDDPLLVLVIELLLDIEWPSPSLSSSVPPERAVICAGWTARSLYSPELPCDSARVNLTLLSCGGRSISNAMTVDSDAPICVEIGVSDPEYVQQKLPPLMLIANTAQAEENTETDEGRGMSPPRPRSVSPVRASVKDVVSPEPIPDLFQRHVNASASVVIDGPFPKYDVNLSLEEKDPLRSSRYQVKIDWFECAHLVEYRSIIIALHIFGERAFRSNPVQLDHGDDLVLKRVPIRSPVSVTFSFLVDAVDHDAFVMHLYERTAVIEVWDELSHFLIGGSRLQLRCTLRQRQASVEAHAALPIECAEGIRGRIGITVRHFGVAADDDPTSSEALITTPHPYGLPKPKHCSGGACA